MHIIVKIRIVVSAVKWSVLRKKIPKSMNFNSRDDTRDRLFVQENPRTEEAQGKNCYSICVSWPERDE